MSLHTVSLSWSRATPDFTYDTYDRGHTIRYGGGVTVPASSAPEFLGDAARVNPEETLAAALGSCHMLTFLAICARNRFVVESYEDEPTAVLEKNAAGRLAITTIHLKPRVVFSGAAPDAEKIRSLHDKAHTNCFIANSILSAVTIEPQ